MKEKTERNRMSLRSECMGELCVSVRVVEETHIGERRLRATDGVYIHISLRTDCVVEIRSER